MSLTTQEIREYNKQVQAFQKKATSLQAEIEVKKKTLDETCAALSEMCGQTITPDNIEEYAAKLETSFEQTVKAGREVLARAEQEEKRLDAVVMGTDAQPEVTPVTPQPTQHSDGVNPFGGFPAFSGRYDTTGKVGGI